MNPSISLPPAAIVMGSGNESRVYPSRVKEKLSEVCDLRLGIVPQQIPEFAKELAEVRFLFSGWGGPRLDEATLPYFPKLEAVFYGAGSIRSIVCDAFWERNIPVCSAWAANAVPVAEFTFAQIILGLKQTLPTYGLVKKTRSYTRTEHVSLGGAFGTTVGLVSLGQIGRRVAEMLKQLEVQVLVYDPFFPQEKATALGVELVSLEALFERSRVVSLHAPWLPETVGMITGALLERMPPGGTFINTARGAIVNEPELIEVMKKRDDLTAVLDVVYPEPAPPESALYDLPNVFLSPHIAGSDAGECARMGMYMVEECQRFIAGEPLQWCVSREAAAVMA